MGNDISLEEACRTGNITVARNILDKIIRDDDYWIYYLDNSLSAAFYNGHKDIVKLFLDCYEKDHIILDNLSNALYYACEYNFIDNVKYLLTKTDFRERSITAVCKNGHTEIFMLILVKDFLISPDAVKIACDNNHLEIIQLIMKHGANINYYIILDYACKFNHIDIAKEMLHRLANTFLDSTEINNILAVTKNEDIIILLIQYGADISNCPVELSIDSLNTLSRTVKLPQIYKTRLAKYKSYFKNIISNFLITDLSNLILNYY